MQSQNHTTLSGGAELRAADTGEVVLRDIYIALDIPLSQLEEAQNRFLLPYMTPRCHDDGERGRFLHLTLALISGITEAQVEILRTTYLERTLPMRFSPLEVKGVGGAIEYPKEALDLFLLHAEKETTLNSKKRVLSLSPEIHMREELSDFNRVVWLSVEVSEELGSIREALKEILESLGIGCNIRDRTEGGYHPHITLGSYSVSKPKYDSHGHPKEPTLGIVGRDAAIPAQVSAVSISFRRQEGVVLSIPLVNPGAISSKGIRG